MLMRTWRAASSSAQDVDEQRFAAEEIGGHTFQRDLCLPQVKDFTQLLAQAAKGLGGCQVRGPSAKIEALNRFLIQETGALVDLSQHAVDHGGCSGRELNCSCGKRAEAAASNFGIAERVRQDSHEQSAFEPTIPQGHLDIVTPTHFIGGVGHRCSQGKTVQQPMPLRLAHPSAQERGQFVRPPTGGRRQSSKDSRQHGAASVSQVIG